MNISIVEQGSAETFRKTINDNFSELEVLEGSGPPSESTAGVVGQTYLDTQAGRSYICVEEGEENYIWKSNSGGGVGITVSSETPSYPQAGDLWYQIL